MTPQGASAAVQRVRKLCHAHPPLLQRDLTVYGRPSIIRVTAHGARLADVGLAPAKVVLAAVPHALAVVDLAEELSGRYPDASLVTERECWAERYREWRAGERPSTGLIPNAVLIWGTDVTEHTIAVVLDRTARSRTDAEAFVTAYLAESFTEVWWYVRPSRVNAMTEIVRRMGGGDLIEVRPWAGG